MSISLRYNMPLGGPSTEPQSLASILQVDLITVVALPARPLTKRVLQAKRRSAMRYFELFLSDHRLPAAMAYQQIRSLGAEYKTAQKLRLALLVSRSGSAETKHDHRFRSEEASKFADAINALTKSAAIELIFLIDGALEMLQFDLDCERKDLAGSAMLLPDVSLFQALRALSNRTRHRHGKEANWTKVTVQKLGLESLWPGSLELLPEFFCRVPFKTWTAFERCLIADARILARQLIV